MKSSRLKSDDEYSNKVIYSDLYINIGVLLGFLISGIVNHFKLNILNYYIYISLLIGTGYYALRIRISRQQGKIAGDKNLLGQFRDYWKSIERQRIKYFLAIGLASLVVPKFQESFDFYLSKRFHFNSLTSTFLNIFIHLGEIGFIYIFLNTFKGATSKMIVGFMFAIHIILSLVVSTIIKNNNTATFFAVQMFVFVLFLRIFKSVLKLPFKNCWLRVFKDSANMNTVSIFNFMVYLSDECSKLASIFFVNLYQIAEKNEMIKI